MGAYIKQLSVKVTREVFTPHEPVRRAPVLRGSRAGGGQRGVHYGREGDCAVC
jgi:hypothetical protein